MGKKKKEQRIISWILIIALTFTCISAENLTVQAEGTPKTEEITEEVGEDKEAEPVAYEVTESDAMKKENTETSTTFDVGDNKKMTVFYQDPIRYEDENGKLVDYDPSLKEIDEKASSNNEDLDGYVYENTQGDKKQYFPETVSEETPILMEHEGYSLKMNPAEEVQPVSVEKEEYTNGYEETKELPLKAVYESEESKISYEYTSSETGVKEEIILSEKPENNTFTYDLRLEGMTARKNATNEGITLYDESSEEIVGSIAAPNMNDASMNAYSEALTIEICKDEEQKGLYHITITADRDYLDAPERQYPVTIDPTATWSGKTNLGDVYVLSGTKYKGINFYDNGVVVVNCGKGSKGIYRTYLGFTDLTAKVKGYYVDSAVLRMYETANSNSGQTVQAYKVKSSWTRAGITWNNKPGYETLYSTVKSTGKYKTARDLNLTAFARSLANGSASNYGIMLKGATETGKYCEFVGSRHSASSLRPKLTVVYYDKPTTPSSVSATPQYLKKGNPLTVAWSGISSKSLAYTQYRVASYDPAANKDISTAIAYSASRKLGTSGSGKAAVEASKGWNEGAWRIYARGIDNGGIAGGERGAVFYIDGTAPTLDQPTIEPISSKEEPAASPTPTINWSGAGDKYFNRVQYKIDNGSFVSMGTTASGSYTVPDGAINGNGAHVITVQAVDKAGNTKEYKLDYFLREEWKGFESYLPKEKTLSVRKDYGKTLIQWETEKPLDDSVYYRIYRGESEDFEISEETLVCPKVKKGYWIDVKNAGGKDYYYKLEVVKTNTDNEVEYSVPIEGTLSMTGIDPKVLPDRTGSKSYLGYYTYDTPSGNGTIENSSGNLTYTQEDATLPSSQLPFDVTRTYNSQSKIAGMFGEGWSDSLHKELVEHPDGTICYMDSDGAVYTFEKGEDGYSCKQNSDLILQTAETASETENTGAGTLSSQDIGSSEYTVEGAADEEEETEEETTNENTDETDTIKKEHCYTIKTKDGYLHRFNRGGQLVSTIEPNETFLLYLYSADGRLESVKTNAGKEITLSYHEDGTVKEIVLPDKTVLSYSYKDDRLSQMKHSSSDGKQSVAYDYSYTEEKLSGVTDGKGQQYKFGYQEEKAVKVTYPNGETYTLSYTGDKTAVTKKSENGKDIYTTSITYDKDSGKLLKETDAEGNTTTYAYGYSKNPYLVIGTTRKAGYEKLENGKVVLHEEQKTTTTTYDDNENVKKEVDEDGTETTYTYPKEGDATEWNEDQPIKTEAVLNGTVISKEETAYDPEGNITKEADLTDPDNPSVTVNQIDEDGNVTESVTTENDITTEESSYTYDADGNVIEESSASADVTSQDTSVYDAMGRILKSTDEKTGEVTEYTYDYLGREIKKTTTLNGKTQTSTASYDENGTVASETDTSGVTTTYKYDKINRVTERTVTKGESITYTTEYAFADVTIQDITGERTIANAYVEKETYPDGSVASEKYYDGSGKVVREKANGIYTDYSYDKSGNQIGTYTNGTKARAITGKRSMALYDADGRQTHTIVNPVIQGGEILIDEETSIVTSQEYDDKGNVIKETDALGVVTGYAYDDSARVTEVTQNAGKDGALTTKAEYEANTENQQNTTTITDPMGHTRTEVTDAAGLTKKTADYGEGAEESIATAYEYDSQGNQTKVTYESGDYRTDTYDDRNLLTVSKGFDTNDKQTLQTDYVYDDQYRQIQMTDAKLTDGAMKPYRYTYTGYDDFGRTAWSAEVSSESEPTKEQIEKHKIRYTYDAEDKITAIYYALVKEKGVESLHFSYDSNRWLTGVQAKIKGSEEKRDVRTYTYDEQGKVAVVKEYTDFISGSDTCITKIYSYNELNLVSAMAYKKGDTLLEEYAYQYDKNSNIIQKKEKNLTPKSETERTDVTKDYTYDALGQLIKTEVTDHRNNNSKTEITYTYDKAGNRTKQTEGGEETVYTYNGLNQLQSAVTELGEVTKHNRSYEYDMNGNQVKETDTKTGVTTTHEYDTENRLSKASVTSQEKNFTQENLYNGEGQRIQKKEGAEVTNYFYQDGVVSYTTGEDTEEKWMQNLLGLEGNIIGAQTEETKTDDTGENTTKVSAYFLYNKDIQGSTTSILNQVGEGELSYTYDDFGETKVHGSSALKNEICYTGGIYDASTGLYYLNARYYDPENGRFLTQDTYRGELNDPDTLHLYAYCKNDPVNYVDPSGHKFLSNVFVQRVFVKGLKYLAKKVLKIPSKKEHYARNKYNTKLPKNKTKAKSEKYKKQSEENSACHQFSAPRGKRNLKYVSKNGKKEVVYTWDGKRIVRDPRDIGTYNFGGKDEIKHLFMDLLPYLWWGNSKADRTTRSQRVTKAATGWLVGKTKKTYNTVTSTLKKNKKL